MKFGWKVLIPANVAWIIVVATLRLMTQEGASQFMMAGFVGVVILGVLIATSVYESSKKRVEAEAQYLPDLPAPSFPVPELPTRAEVESKQ
jgi:NADH-quinone oxidoreductase subunit H